MGDELLPWRIEEKPPRLVANRWLSKFEEYSKRSSETMVVFLGPEGSGRSLLAHHMHKHLQVQGAIAVKAPFVRLRSKLLNPSESVNQLRTACKCARSGTIFIQEVDALAPIAQEELLQMLKRRPKLNCRVFCSAPLDFQSKQNFDYDLFQALTNYPIIVNRLMDRGADLIVLIRHFFKLYNPKLTRLPGDFLFTLMVADYPKNVAELISIIKDACQTSRGETGLMTLPALIRDFTLSAHDTSKSILFGIGPLAFYLFGKPNLIQGVIEYEQVNKTYKFSKVSVSKLPEFTRDEIMSMHSNLKTKQRMLSAYENWECKVRTARDLMSKFKSGDDFYSMRHELSAKYNEPDTVYLDRLGKVVVLNKRSFPLSHTQFTIIHYMAKALQDSGNPYIRTSTIRDNLLKVPGQGRENWRLLGVFRNKKEAYNAMIDTGQRGLCRLKAKKVVFIDRGTSEDNQNGA